MAFMSDGWQAAVKTVVERQLVEDTPFVLEKFGVSDAHGFGIDDQGGQVEIQLFMPLF